MTDYFYQATARNDPPEDEGEAPYADADLRRNVYPPEDEAYWAEAGASSPVDEPLWYEDRVGLADTGRAMTGTPALPRESPPRPPPRWTERELPPASDEPPREAEAYWETDPGAETGNRDWRDPEAGETEDVTAWSVEPGAVAWNPEPAFETADARAYVAGASAAAGTAAAESGERRIRFDPTQERGAVSYDRAARHSRRVRLLKIGLPSVAVLSIIGFFVVLSWPAGDDGLPALSLSGINIESREITMDNPNISGFDGTKRAYEVHAVKATQELGNAKVVTLEQIQARFALGDDVRANIEAATGVYDGNTQKLQLKGGITLSTTNGYHAELKDADVDIEKGTVASTTGVAIQGKEGSVTANAIEVLDHGKHIFLRGDVKVHFQPPETPAKDSGNEAAATPPAVTPAAIEALPDGST